MNYHKNQAPGRPESQVAATPVASQHAITPKVLDRPSDPEHLLCFSHLRWGFVYQRPQHLLSRWTGLSANARMAPGSGTVWFMEEPVHGDTLHLDIRPASERVRVVVPHLPHGVDDDTAVRLQRQLVNQLLDQEDISNFVAWYYTPMALRFSAHLNPRLTVYDCMDELSAFAGASPLLLAEEEKLLRRADLVFTGGQSLYEAKQHRHPAVSAFPSCIDYHHFAAARRGLPDPADQQHLTGPRMGYSGVIDERFDVALLRDLADSLPDWQFILLGPVVKIDPATLPQGPNLHYLGQKAYADLPAYMSNWDVALLPFVRNAATRYLSPTKTPEYLAAGLPVIATPIRDVVNTYGNWPQVMIADSVDAIRQGLDRASQTPQANDWTALDAFLRQQSWDVTFQQMHRLMRQHSRIASTANLASVGIRA